MTTAAGRRRPVRDDPPMTGGAVLTAAEAAALDRAVLIAGLGAGSAPPNPVVGCVLIGPGGTTVGEGSTSRPVVRTPR